MTLTNGIPRMTVSGFPATKPASCATMTNLTSENCEPGEALVSNVGAHVGNANAEAVAEGNQARKISLPSRGECRNSDQRGEQQHRGDSRDGSNVRHVGSPLSP